MKSCNLDFRVDRGKYALAVEIGIDQHFGLVNLYT